MNRGLLVLFATIAVCAALLLTRDSLLPNAETSTSNRPEPLLDSSVVDFLLSDRARTASERLIQREWRELQAKFQFLYLNDERVADVFKPEAGEILTDSVICHETGHILAPKEIVGVGTADSEAFAQLTALSSGMAPYQDLANLLDWEQARFVDNDHYYDAAILVLTAIKREVASRRHDFLQIPDNEELLDNLDELSRRDISELASAVMTARYGRGGSTRENHSSTPLMTDSMRLLEAGVEKVREGDLSDATELLKQAIAADPKNVEALVELGALTRGKYDTSEGVQHRDTSASIRYLERAKAIASDDAKVALELGLAYRQRRWYADALSELRRATTLGARDAGVWISIGELSACLGDLDQAHAAYRSALEHEPNHPDALVYAAVARAHLDQNIGQNMEESLRRAIAVAPDHAEACYWLGIYFATKGNCASSAHWLERFCDLDKTSVAGLLLLGFQQVNCNQLEEAYRTVKMAIAKAPERVAAYEMMSLICFNTGRIEEADSMAKKSVDLDPWSGHARLLLSLAAVRGGNLGDAIDALTVAEKLAPESADIAANELQMIRSAGEEVLGAKSLQALNFFFKAEEHFKKKEYAEAAVLYEKAIAADPTFAKAHLHLGDALFFRGRYSEAAKEFTVATELNPEDKLGWFFLGDVYLQMKDYRRAEEAYRRCLTIDPNYSAAKDRMEQARQGIGD